MFSFEKITIFLLLWARAVYMSLHSTMTHHWTFNEPFPYEDHKTGQRVKLIGDKKPLNTTGYLTLVGESCLILGSITDRCLANMTTCHSGYSVAFWVQIKATATSPQILLGTSRNGSDIHGVFVYQTEAIRRERRLIVEVYVDGLSWSVPLTVPQEMWVFIALSWNIKDDIFSVYNNGNNVSTTAGKYGSEHSLRKHVKLRGSFPRQVVPPSLYLESGGLYDEVMTWKRSLDHSEVKRLFQAQMNELSKIKCTTTATTLNITWQAINRTIFTKVRETNQGYEVKVWRNKQRIAFMDLESSIRTFFLKRMVPYASYKVRLWKGGQRIGAVVCRTKEGVPTKVQNMRITARNSTSLLVQWSPPAQINGLLLGYNLTVKKHDFYRVITVKDTTKYLVTGLKPDTMYTIEVQSYTAAGSGPQPPSDKTATKKVPNVTEMPRNLSAFAVSWNTMKVTWTLLDEKEEVTSYDVEYCPEIGCHTVSVFDSSVMIDNLTQHTTYTVKVRGRNSMYAGPWRIASGVKTLGEATRTCSAVGKVTWQNPDLCKCVSKRFLDLKSKLSSQMIDSDTAVSLANNLKQITDPADDDLIVSGDLYTAVDILQTLGQKTATNVTMNKEEAETFMSSVISVASNLLAGKVIDVWQESSVASRSSRATKLLISIENMALMTASVANSTNATSIETPNVVLKFRSLKKDTFAQESVFFTTSGHGNGNGNGIKMPTSEIHKGSEGTINIAFIYMRNIGQLLSNSLSSPFSEQNKTDRINSDSSTSVGSGVISLSTSRKTSGNFDEPVEIILQSNKSDHNLCVFWKIEGDAGSWSTEGCLVNFVNSTHTVCHCYHLTSFSVLMQYTRDSHSIEKSDELALSLITYVGISISLVALVIALVTFCSVGFLKSNRNFAHINLVLSLILAELLFVFGIDKIQYQTACFVIAVFLHYLFLVAFSWMATEGVILYLMLVKVFPTASEGPKKRLLFICSWGIPTIPVASAILINKQGYTTEKHCWLSVDEGFVWSFIGPVLLVCVVNIVFLGMTFKAMADRTSKQYARKPPQMRYWVKACAVLTCLLGTTWLLGLFFVGKSSVVMAYLFNIFNVLQGVFIFIFHCLADERVRAQYRRVICCHGNRREYLRNKSVVKSEQHKHSHSTMSSRFADKKSKSEVSLEKKPSFCDAETVAVTRDSSGILFAEQEPIQGTDRYLEITSMPVTAHSELTPPLDIFSDVDETDHHDDDEKSVDMFFEDISLSLIDIRKDRTSSSLDCKSIISNPLESM